MDSEASHKSVTQEKRYCKLYKEIVVFMKNCFSSGEIKIKQLIENILL